MPDSLAQLRRTDGESGPRQPPPCLLPGFTAALRQELFRSRRSEQSLHDDQAVATWVAKWRSMPLLQARPTRLDQLEGWHIDPASGNIAHDSGRFFTVTGIHARHRVMQLESEWDQPIIDQPEVGILGILAHSIDGVLHFCLQAKEEPGNIGGMQLSPTVQATYSNYTGAHGGTAPPFIASFLDPPAERIIFARLQSEDGGRFLYKSNRNMVVLLPTDAPTALPEGFIWLNLRQIANLLRQDNLVHAATRSILAALLCCGDEDWLAAASDGRPTENGTLADTLLWFDSRKAQNHFMLRRTGINTLREWRIDNNGFLSHREERFFRIIGLNVSGAAREVATWSQPILCNPEHGIVGLLRRTSGGRRFFLMQVKAEVGNRNIVQLAPSVQFTPGNYTHNPRLPKPFLFDLFSEPDRLPVLWENLQAEEGARFYQECHHHRILQLPEGCELELPPDFRWLSEEEVRFFLHFGDLVNSCARSILACLL